MDRSSDHGITLLVHVEPRDIDLFNKLFEGYDNLALVTTIHAESGKIALRAAASACKDLLAILRCFPIPVTVEQA